MPPISLNFISQTQKVPQLMETQSISSFHFPPGVRFHPSDEELIIYYLQNKVKSLPVPAGIIAEIELYGYNPWELPKKAFFGDEEWYFFTPRDRKYPNGARPNRTAASGYWKATGTDKPIINSSGARIGVKKALVFYIGKPPSGAKTDWLMIEYRMPDSPDRPSRSKGSMRLDDWVLCRIKQKGNMSKNSWELPQCRNKDLGEVTYVKEELPNPNPSGLYTQNNPNPSELCSNYFLSKDCHLLAKILANDHHHRDFPSVESDNNAATSQSSIISSSNCNNNSTAYDEHLMNNPLFGSTFNQRAKRGNENECDSSAGPPKKAMVNFTGTVTTANGGSMFYNQQHQSNGDNWKLNIQELDVYAFAQRFLQ